MFYDFNSSINYGSGNDYEMEYLPTIYSGQIMDKEMLI